MKATDVEQRIREVETSLRLAEAEYGTDDPRVADCLEACAKLFKENKVRLLDAANMQARAGVIRSTTNTVRREPPRALSVEVSEPLAESFAEEEEEEPEDEPEPESEFKLCPFCAEEIKTAAVKCKHCGSDVSEKPRKKKRPTQPVDCRPTKEKTIGELIKEDQSGSRKRYRDTVQDLSSKDLGVLTFEFSRRRKSVGVAYLLCILLGVAGIHKFYLKSAGAGLFYLLMLLTSWFVVPAVILGLLIIIDLCSLPGQVEAYNNHLKKEIIRMLRD